MKPTLRFFRLLVPVFLFLALWLSNDASAQIDTKSLRDRFGDRCIIPATGRFVFDREAKVMNFKVLSCEGEVLVWVFDYYKEMGIKRPAEDHST